MKQTFTIAILCALTFAVFAQNPQPLYTVQPNDTVWELSGVKLDNPTQWQKVVAANPFLQEAGRVFKASDGKTVVLIKPGEQLAGLEAAGILPQVANLAQLGIAPPPPPPPTESYTWLRVLFGILILIGLLGYLAHRKWLRPEQAGPAVIRGGINNDTAPEVMRAQAAHDFGLPVNGIQVMSISAGTATGWANVGYADHDRPQYLRERACFECVYTADGHEGEQRAYSLQGCANPVRYGRPDVVPGQDFVFTPNRVGAAVELPVSWTKDDAPTHRTALPPTIQAETPAITQAATDDHPSRLTVHFDANSATVQTGTKMLRVDNMGQDVAINRSADGIVFTRGDFRVTVTPGVLVLPDAPKPAERILLEAKPVAELPPSPPDTAAASAAA